MGPPFIILLYLGFTILNGVLALPAQYATADKELYKPEHCVPMTPQKEDEINSIAMKLSEYLYNLSLQYDELDVRLVKIVVESHSEFEKEEKEMQVQLVVNDCTYKDMVVDDADGEAQITKQTEQVNKSADESEYKTSIETESSSSKKSKASNSKESNASTSEETKEVNSNESKKKGTHEIRTSSSNATNKSSAVETKTNSSNESKKSTSEESKRSSSQVTEETQSSGKKTASQSSAEKSESKDTKATSSSQSKSIDKSKNVASAESEKSVSKNDKESSSVEDIEDSVLIVESRNDTTNEEVNDNCEEDNEKVPKLMLLDLDEKGNKLVKMYEKKHGRVPLLLYVRKVSDNIQYLFLN